MRLLANDAIHGAKFEMIGGGCYNQTLLSILWRSNKEEENFLRWQRDEEWEKLEGSSEGFCIGRWLRQQKVGIE